jgi:hypothetical protein
MAGLRTEFPFTLPKGLIDSDGQLNQKGTMRLATARDELEPLNDPKIRDADDPYLSVIVLSRVITQLGSHNRLTPRDVDGLFAADLAYLQDVYAIINYGTAAEVQRYLDQALGKTTTSAIPTDPEPATTGSPVSDAARSMMARDGAVSNGAPDDHDEDVSDAQPLRTPPRRARIEEVGRSSGRPG